ncbi:MAG: hypothetical protein NTV81_03805 [Candidatus Komeilibacteria bacterium]|nr:hypothetical protein [Candidatus Komeilibacteria bacterium]
MTTEQKQKEALVAELEAEYQNFVQQVEGIVAGYHGKVEKILTRAKERKLLELRTKIQNHLKE